MATMTVSLPGPMKDWVEQQIETGAYASSSDYVRDLIRRDRERRDQAMTLDELRQLVADARASGESDESVGAIFDRAKAIIRSRGVPRG
ncbi:type II toxin-antitoxin system ParD family antitoxin [Methylobacterium iners]|uniref:Antitoxin ParD4 n=1 Tax=Methylobacterium iners TaxID=418707 RepID=A0ABQ4RY17_9HYPH|nr:type II toxin-antitoxin system ParD family antitoxin [Methylobacterium iners]GJD95083.1 Antitoxin ParD4 [Methylobacterium iners]